jgi:hypothetical protein
MLIQDETPEARKGSAVKAKYFRKRQKEGEQ